MSVNVEPYLYWLQANKGKRFRRKRGKIVYQVEDLKIDYSYDASYNFVWIYPVLRRLDNGRRVSNIELSEFKYGFVEADA